MKQRTWPYGTRYDVRVEGSRNAHHEGKPVHVLVVIAKAINEAFILLNNSAEERKARRGDFGTIVFTQGGPMGGYWKYEPEANEKVGGK